MCVCVCGWEGAIAGAGAEGWQGHTHARMYVCMECTRSIYGRDTVPV